MCVETHEARIHQLAAGDIIIVNGRAHLLRNIETQDVKMEWPSSRGYPTYRIARLTIGFGWYILRGWDERVERLLTRSVVLAIPASRTGAGDEYSAR